LAIWALPLPARADCGVTASGIPNDVITPIDVDHVRKSLADIGIGIGGYTVNESFADPSGGIHQAPPMTVCSSSISAEDGLWKGLCFYANGFQIRGRSITRPISGVLRQ
jgi:hypothetical protein